MKKLFPVIMATLAVLLLVVVSVVACGPSASPQAATGPVATKPAALKTYEWKLGQRYAPGTFIANAAEDLIKRVSQASNGRIKITHYPGDPLGDYTVQNQSVSLGKQDITMTAAVASDNPKQDAKMLPFMMYGLGQAYDFVRPGGWLIVPPLLTTTPGPW